MKSKYLLSGALAGLLGCAQINKYFQPQEQPIQIRGILKDEFYARSIFTDVYSFSIITAYDGIEVFNCSGIDAPRKMNAVLSPGDELILLLDAQQYRDKTDLDVCLDDVVWLNGKSVRRK